MDFIICGRCSGSGIVDEDGFRFGCPDCDGTGEIDLREEEQENAD